MLKSIVSGLVGFVIAFAAMFAGNPSFFQKSGGIPTLEDGQYTAYSVKPMFDQNTGEPVYWVVGGQGRMEVLYSTAVYIEPREVQLYTIPRSKLAGLPAKGGDAPDDHSYRITVADGTGYVVARR